MTQGAKVKKLLAALLTVLLILSLCACAQEKSTIYTVNVNGKDYVVDMENSTIFDGTYTYPFVLSTTGNGYKVEFTYPDGSTFWWYTIEYGSYGGWSNDYSAARYVDGDVLCQVLEAEMTVEPAKKVSGGLFLMSIVLLAVGMMNVASPHTAWYVEYGWRYKDAEPSDLALAANRVGGVVAIIVAVIVFLAAIF